MQIDISTDLACNSDEAIAHVKTSRLLSYIAWPLISFTPIANTSLPEIWHEGRYWVVLKLFGFIPLCKQAIVISYPSTSIFILRDDGHNVLIPKWEHVITIEPSGNNTRYRDLVTIEAGILTPVFWLFAKVFYCYRQYRWRKLACSGFAYANVE